MLKENVFKIVFILVMMLITSPLYSQDTIYLNTLQIDKKSYKKAKLIEVKKGFKEQPFVNSIEDYFAHEYFYRINFPLGQPVELTLFFEGGWMKDTKKWSGLDGRSFEADLFYALDDNVVGGIITKNPIKIDLPRSTDPYHNVKLQLPLKDFNLYGNVFLLRLRTPTKLLPNENFQYWPVVFKENNSLIIKTNGDDPKTYTIFDAFNLKHIVKVLTNEY